MPIDITDVTRRVQYAGSGTGPYNFTFQILDDDDIAVYQDDTLLVKTTDYTVTINVDGTGSITTVSSIPGADNITIIGARPYARLSDFSTGGDFFADDVNDELDSMMILIQQLREENDRALSMSSTTAYTGSLQFPPPGAGEFLRWNTGGTALETVSAAPDEGVFQQSGTGAVERSWTSKVGDIVNADDFGADKTGATNTTTALKNFFDYCISSGKPGHIPAGDYLITAGVLVFDNGFVDKAWPDITTDGYERVTFKRADATNSPMITISNGTATSGVGKYWKGGSLGGITFDQNGKTTASGQHGLSLRGCEGVRFGWMRGLELGGSTVVLPETLFGGSNPDPYAVASCRFEGIEGDSNKRYALQNNNWNGLTGCRIGVLRVVNGELGGWLGFGSGNFVDVVSMGTVAGWALDDATQSGAAGGPPNRVFIGAAEFDDVQNGLRLNRTTVASFKALRFVHRYNFSSLNPSEGYWPRIAIDVAGGASPSCNQIDIQVTHRVESGGTKPDMGVFVDLNSTGNAGFMTIDQSVTDNAGFGFVDSDLYTGFSSSARVVLTKAGKIINKSKSGKSAIVARGSSAGTALTVGADPLTTTNGSNIVNVTMTGHGLVVGQCFTLQGAALTRGVPAAELNRSHPVTSVVDANNVTITVETNATSDGTGGGAGCTAAKDRSFLNITGVGTIKCKLALPTSVSDQESYFSATQYEYTVPYTGLYRVSARIAWTGLSAGNRVRLYIYANVGTSPAVALHGEHRCQGSNVETFAISDVVSLTAGQKLSVNCDCNASAALAMSFVATNDVTFSVEAL